MPPPLHYNAAAPWERQPCDTDEFWPLFQDWLTQNPRDLRRLSVVHKVSWTALSLAAWEFGWNTRADLWDRHLDGLRRATIEKEVQEDAKARARRHLRYTGKAGAILEGQLDRMRALGEQDGPLVFTPRDAIRWLALIVRTERLAAGDVSELAADTVDLSNLTVDELRSLRELQQKTRAA